MLRFCLKLELSEETESSEQIGKDFHGSSARCRERHLSQEASDGCHRQLSDGTQTFSVILHEFESIIHQSVRQHLECSVLFETNENRADYAI